MNFILGTDIETYIASPGRIGRHYGLLDGLLDGLCAMDKSLRECRRSVSQQTRLPAGMSATVTAWEGSFVGCVRALTGQLD